MPRTKIRRVLLVIVVGSGGHGLVAKTSKQGLFLEALASALAGLPRGSSVGRNRQPASGALLASFENSICFSSRQNLAQGHGRSPQGRQQAVQPDASYLGSQINFPG